MTTTFIRNVQLPSSQGVISIQQHRKQEEEEMEDLSKPSIRIQVFVKRDEKIVFSCQPFALYQFVREDSIGELIKRLLPLVEAGGSDLHPKVLAACTPVFLAQAHQQYCLATFFTQRALWDKAIPLLEQAAHAGHAQAEHDLALCCERGYGMNSPDLTQAATLYHSAARKGYPPAEFALGRFREKGMGGLEEDLKGAIAMYRLAGEEYHYAPAQLELAMFYEDGVGVEKDLGKAAWLCAQAAAQGYPEAIQRLGFHYRDGLGVPQDEAKANDLFDLAAEQSYWPVSKPAENEKDVDLVP